MDALPSPRSFWKHVGLASHCQAQRGAPSRAPPLPHTPVLILLFTDLAHDDNGVLLLQRSISQNSNKIPIAQELFRQRRSRMEFSGCAPTGTEFLDLSLPGAARQICSESREAAPLPGRAGGGGDRDQTLVPHLPQEGDPPLVPPVRPQGRPSSTPHITSEQLRAPTGTRTAQVSQGGPGWSQEAIPAGFENGPRHTHVHTPREQFLCHV